MRSKGLKHTRNIKLDGKADNVKAIIAHHLGHVISSDLDDKHDISRGRSALVSQINNVLCFFRTLGSVTKMRLLIAYCYSLYVVLI